MEISYCFDDILISPRYSDIKTRNDIDLKINIGINGRKLILKTPLISSPMDTVSMSLMCIKMALYGGIGILHRYQSIENQVNELIKVKRFLQYIIINPHIVKPNYSLQYVEELKNDYKVSTFCVVNDNNELIGLITNRDMEYTTDKPLLVSDVMNEKLYVLTIAPDELNNIQYIIQNAKLLMIKYKVEKIPIIEIGSNKLIGLITWKNVKHFENNASQSCLDANGKLCCGAAIGITGDWWERLEALINANVDCICIDVANGYNDNVRNAIYTIRQKYPSLVIIAGNVCTGDGFKYLADCDVDCIRVGIGNGSICSTRGETGIGRGQFTSIIDIFDTKNKYNLNNIIISDGGSLNSVGNKAKALIAGAGIIMLGRTLAATEESPSMIIYKDGQKYKYTRGMASTIANISKMELCNDKGTIKKHCEGIDGYTPLKGTVKDIIDETTDGIKSAFSYIGCNSIHMVHNLRIQNIIKFNIMTPIGINESHTRLHKF